MGNTPSLKNWNNIDFNTATIEFILPSRLIGPPIDWAYAQWFIQGNEESIYGKLFKNNMEGSLSSFYPVVEGIDHLVNSDTEVALFQFMNLHSFQEYQCKVKTLKKIVKSLLWVHNGVFNLLAFKDSCYDYFSCFCLR